MSLTTGILLFNGVEELDFAGPWEVLGIAASLEGAGRVVSVAEQTRPVRCAGGLSLNPEYSFSDAPKLDVLVVPGGRGTRTEINNAALIDWLRDVSPRCQWVTSVCTGALLLHEAGIARGKRVTTHWKFVDTLRERGDVTVLDDKRYVQDGNLVTAAGISAGIDMALWLVGQLYGVDRAREVRRHMQYDPEPPYASETQTRRAV